ncbi:DUF4190 domain-containing protein [Williamsia sterculiae]|uniref:DUF4190 domain-containing protein n=1 Tax=Williamsia sterculiae TaxID=1344003 RepID=A0A1N7GFZ7_9NOCA|nr:DUF4190 domain-containing protein [Williamsia sterculiae]SIS11501.1 protein of unknown function [Williamsia sterculiae]
MTGTARFNPPPNWPKPVDGWTPPPNWVPDPSWPDPPKGWRLWVDETPAEGTKSEPNQSPEPAATAVTPTAPGKTNDLAVAALICGLVISPVGIILGHISLSQIKKRNESGRGLALAGLIIGYAFTAIALIAIIASVMAFSSAVSSINDAVATTTSAPDSVSDDSPSESTSGSAPTSSSSSFASREQAVEYAVPMFNSGESSSAEQLFGADYLVREPSDSDNADDLAKHVLEQWQINLQTIMSYGETNYAEGVKLLDAAVDKRTADSPPYANDVRNPSHLAFSDFIAQQISQSQRENEGKYEVVDHSVIFQHTQFQSVEPSGEKTIILTARNPITADIVQYTFQKQRGTNPQNNMYVLVQVVDPNQQRDYMAPSQPYYIEKLADLKID